MSSSQDACIRVRPARIGSASSPSTGWGRAYGRARIPSLKLGNVSPGAWLGNVSHLDKEMRGIVLQQIKQNDSNSKQVRNNR